MKIKQLEWTPVQGGNGALYAKSPASTSMDSCFYIFFEPNEIGNAAAEHLYWPSWDLTLQGTTDLQSLKDNAQATHERWFKDWIEC